MGMHSTCYIVYCVTMGTLFLHIPFVYWKMGTYRNATPVWQLTVKCLSIFYSFKINVALLALLGGRDTKTLGMSTHAHILPHSHNLEDMGGDNTEPNILVLMKLKGMCIITGGEDTQTSNCMAWAHGQKLNSLLSEAMGTLNPGSGKTKTCCALALVIIPYKSHGRNFTT